MGIKKSIKKKVKRTIIGDEEFKRLKKTETYSKIKDFRDDRYIAKEMKKGEYATLRAKKKHYALEKKGKLTNEEKEIILNKVFEKQCGYKINFEEPRTYNEKLMWMKLYYENPLITKCADKFAMKDYVSTIVGEEYVVPVIKSWTNPDHINFDELPDQYVIKVNWSSGYLKVVKDKSQIDTEELRKQIRKWIKPYRNSYYQTFNWGYKNMPPMIFAEKYIEQKDEQVYDYKFFCFGGKAECLFIATDRIDKEKDTTFDFYDMDFNPLPITYGHHAHVPEPHQKPKYFEKMKEIAEKLAKPFPHVRVDFYENEDNLYVGEMTFYSGGAILPFEPFSWDEKYGDMIELPEKTVQARDDYFEALTPKEAFMMEDKITKQMQRQYCIQKGYAQMGYAPDLDNPKSFNEKIIWLALNYKNPDIKIGADKFKAKEYIAEKVGKEYVVPLIGAYDDIGEIDFDALPNKFVCKANDGWGNDAVILVKNKTTYALDYLKAQMSTWLYPWASYYYQNMCITDEKVEPKIVVEELLESENGIDDYKFYCCNGEPKFALIVSDRTSKEQTRTFVNMDWEPIPVFRKGKKTASDPKKPENLDEMMRLCRILAKDFPLVRIDFYEVDGKVLVGELTFCPGMFLGLRPIEMDYKLGELLDLSEYM